MDDTERELLDLWLSGVCKGSASVAAPLLVAEVRRLRDENERLRNRVAELEAGLDTALNRLAKGPYLDA